MSKQPPTRTNCKRNRPLPYYHPNCRTPRHWKFTQDHRTTRPPPFSGGWLVGCVGFNGPLRQYFSLYRAVSQREGERGERIDESKNVQTTTTRTYCKRIRPLPYCNQNCRTPRHWKFTQHHRTTRPHPFSGGLGLKYGLVSRLGCRGCGVMFYFLCVPDFVNSCGSDAVLGINDI